MKLLHFQQKALLYSILQYMLNTRVPFRALPNPKTPRSCPGRLHPHRQSPVLSTLAPHSKPSPTEPFPKGSSAARAQQISRHLSTQPLNPEMSSLPISEKGYHANAPGGYAVRKNGAPNTLEHRIYIEKDGVPVSPFHDVPLYANEQQTVLNMIVEIPRWTNAKMEVTLSYLTTPGPLH